MTQKKPIVALIYDYDGTLSPGNMQEFGFIQAVGKTTEEFWRMLWKKLGVRSVSEPGSVVTAGNSRHLAVHTGKAGEFRLSLPGVTRATELYTREKYPVENGVLALKSSGARTWFLELDPARRK